MNKAEAKQQADVLAKSIQASQCELAKLQEIIDAPDPLPSLLTKPEPGTYAGYWVLTTARYGGLAADTYHACSSEGSYYTHGNLFQTEELALAYADAIDTMLLLRHQPGTEPASSERQWVVEAILDYDKVLVKCLARVDLISKLAKTSPCFATLEDATAAVVAVGSENILRMFKTFHHVTD